MCLTARVGGGGAIFRVSFGICLKCRRYECDVSFEIAVEKETKNQIRSLKSVQMDLTTLLSSSSI